MINAFVGQVFHVLTQTLADRVIFRTCGMSQGKMLWCYLSPVGDITFYSGNCGAWVWFDKPGETPCSFIPMCGAYQRKAVAPASGPPPSI